MTKQEQKKEATTNKLYKEWGKQQGKEREWLHAENAKKAHKWIKLMDKAFFSGKLHYPFLVLEPIDWRILGWYRRGHNGAGAKHEIGVNSAHLKRTELETAVTILHEMGHLLHDVTGDGPKRGNYHNKAFTDLMEEFGIPCTDQGVTLEIVKKSKFIRFCKTNGIRKDHTFADGKKVKIPKPSKRASDGNGGSRGKLVPSDPSAKPRKGSKLKKWTCGCQNARIIAKEFDATCDRCEGKFELAE